MVFGLSGSGLMFQSSAQQYTIWTTQWSSGVHEVSEMNPKTSKNKACASVKFGYKWLLDKIIIVTWGKS